MTELVTEAGSPDETDGADAFEAGWNFARQQSNAEIDRLTEEVAELNKVFDLRHRADHRAIELWQAEHPGHESVWPDQTDLVSWLMYRLDLARRERALLDTVVTYYASHGCGVPWSDDIARAFYESCDRFRKASASGGETSAN